MPLNHTMNKPFEGTNLDIIYPTYDVEEPPAEAKDFAGPVADCKVLEIDEAAKAAYIARHALASGQHGIKSVASPATSPSK